MKQKEYNELKDRYDLVEKALREICNLVMKMKRQTAKKGIWFSAGVNPYQPLTDEAQQGPLVTSLYEKIEKARKIVRNI